MNDFITIVIAYSPILIILIFLAIAKINESRREKSSKKEENSSVESTELNKEYNNTGIVQNKERVLAEEPIKSDYTNISERLFELMEREKLFLNPSIRINEVAEKLLTNKAYLSKAIKETTNRNFCQLIHYFRIKEVMKRFAKNPNSNIQDLAKKVGFKSPSTFNIAFGRVSGYTPAEWSRDFKNRQNHSVDATPSKLYSKSTAKRKNEAKKDNKTESSEMGV